MVTIAWPTTRNLVGLRCYLPSSVHEASPLNESSRLCTLPQVEIAAGHLSTL